ncbi:MAG: SsrA-binding protein SmpB [Alphaproteobacteria bacterium]|nr:SsrA-binding protein SmpB [Alphaproteobacteria bacterium]
MAKKENKKTGMISTDKTVSDNRRAKFDFHLEGNIEAGIMLVGTEVKSLRMGQCNLTDSHAGVKEGKIYLFNAYIPEYQKAGPKAQHETRRPRLLLLKKREIAKLIGEISRGGYTLIPTKIYFNKKGLAKVELALAKGKQQRDKRETIKKRDWDRQKHRILKNHD